MKRDRRLLASMMLLIASATLAVLHFNRVVRWVVAFAAHDEATMQDEFGVIPPSNCTYDCYGWGTYPGDYYWLPAIFAFVAAIGLIVKAWWSPKQSRV